MFSDIIELRDFYQSPLGQMARRVLCATVDDLWPNMRGERLLTIGYGLPLLRNLSQRSLAAYGFMPVAQGVAFWPREGPNVSCLVDCAHMPLADASIDRIIILHALEALPEPAALLREIWRVMKNSGRLMAIVPHRHGLWAYNEKTPFGNGQPFSATQIKRLLHEQAFLVERCRSLLYTPPYAGGLTLKLATKIELCCAKLFPSFGGLLAVEAGKQIYAPLFTQAQAGRLVLPLQIPDLMPLPAG